MVRATAFALAACVAWSSSLFGQAVLQRGDLAAVAAGGTPLMVNGQPALQLPKDIWFEVVRSSGSWTAGHAYVDGGRKAGWVLTAKLVPESIARQSEAAAAWMQRGARVERDARGAVLSIDVSESTVGDAEMAQLPVFARLEEVTLGGSQVTAAGLANLALLPRLKRVFLDGLPLADDDLKPLSPLIRLEGLSLADTQITDAGLPHLTKLTNLQVLNLSNCAITDAGLAHLAPLVLMETLALKNTQVRGPGLAHLRSMEPLNVLNLSKCPIEGPYLMNLAGMEHLRILHLADCHVDPEDIEALEEATTSLAVFD